MTGMTTPFGFWIVFILTNVLWSIQHRFLFFFLLGCTAWKSNMILLTFWHCRCEMQNGQLSKYFLCFVWQSTSAVLEWVGAKWRREEKRWTKQKRAEPYLKKHWGSWLENFSLFVWGCHFSHPACVLLLPPSGKHRNSGRGEDGWRERTRERVNTLPP